MFMRNRQAAFTAFTFLASAVASCGSEPASPANSSDVTPTDTVSSVDVVPDGDAVTQSWCRSESEDTFVPSEPYVPEWFSSANGYQRRLAVQGTAVCAVARAGGVFCWGNKAITGLDPQKRDDRIGPLVVDVVKMPLDNIVDVSLLGLTSSSDFGLAIDGSGQAWGWNFYENFFAHPNSGDLDAPLGTPTPIDLGGDALQGVSGLAGGFVTPTIIARSKSGVIWGLGDFWPFLGKPEKWNWEESEPTPETAYPDVVPGVTDFVQIESGTYLFCGVRSNLHVVCWGSSYFGFPEDRWCETPLGHPPTEIHQLRGTVHLALDYSGGCAVKSDGSLWCWGHYGAGAVGDVDPPCSDSDVGVPRQVSCVTGAKSVTASGDGFGCVLHRNGEVRCFHDQETRRFYHCTPPSQSGQPWNCTHQPDNTSYYPGQWPGAKVPGLPSNIREIAGHWDCACALTETDEVYCWGDGACQGSATTDGAWSDAAVLVTRLQ